MLPLSHSPASLEANDHGSDNQMNLSATAATFFPSTPSPSSAGPNLYDMEQQRRQELLARKAAIASRKKQVAPVAASSAKEPKDVEMADTIPTKTVEDFLKSIGPTETPAKARLLHVQARLSAVLLPSRMPWMWMRSYQDCLLIP